MAMQKLLIGVPQYENSRLLVPRGERLTRGSGEGGTTAGRCFAAFARDRRARGCPSARVAPQARPGLPRATGCDRSSGQGRRRLARLLRRQGRHRWRRSPRSAESRTQTGRAHRRRARPTAGAGARRHGAERCAIERTCATEEPYSRFPFANTGAWRDARLRTGPRTEKRATRFNHTT
jgi:hypothetical protein